MKKYILAGLLVWLPLAVTVWVLTWVIGLLDGVFLAVVGAIGTVLPPLAGGLARLTEIPGLGVVLLIVVMLLTGMFVTNIVGQWWLTQWDRLMSRIPIVKSIYT